MKTILLTTLIAIIALCSFSQTNEKGISIVKKKIYDNGEEITRRQLKTLLANDSEANPDYRKFKTNSTTGNVLIGVGTLSILTGAVLNLADAVDDAQKTANGEFPDSEVNSSAIALIIGGAVLDLIGIPFILKGNKDLKNSINAYNSSIGNVSMRPAILDIGLQKHGVGLCLKF